MRVTQKRDTELGLNTMKSTVFDLNHEHTFFTTSYHHSDGMQPGKSTSNIGWVPCYTTIAAMLSVRQRAASKNGLKTTGAGLSIKPRMQWDEGSHKQSSMHRC
jgi:hypothetical protein